MGIMNAAIGFDDLHRAIGVIWILMREFIHDLERIHLLDLNYDWDQQHLYGLLQIPELLRLFAVLPPRELHHLQGILNRHINANINANINRPQR